MAKVPLIHSCGHEAVHNLSGTPKQLEFKVKNLAEAICDACAKRQAKKRFAETIRQMQLPELTGTPAQIPWARDIREEIITRVLEMPGAANAANVIRQAFAQELSAHWWIEHRNAPKATYNLLVSRLQSGGRHKN